MTYRSLERESSRMTDANVKNDLNNRKRTSSATVRRSLHTLIARFRSPRAMLALQVLMIVLCLVPVAWQASQEWDSVWATARQVTAPALIGAVLALLLSSLFLPIAITAFTRGAASRIGYRHSALAYFASQPMKYLPGSFWILPGRVILLRRLGHDLGPASAGLLFEMTTQVLSSALVVAALGGLRGVSSVWVGSATGIILAVSLAASLMLVVSPALVQRAFRRGSSTREALARLAAVPLHVRLANLVATTAAYAIMWLLMGLSFYALMVAAQPRLDPALLRIAVGVSTLSWLAGFLSPISPGGVGVREGVIVLLLTPVVGSSQAVAVALLARAVSLVVELAFAGGAWLLLRRDKRLDRTDALGGASSASVASYP